MPIKIANDSGKGTILNLYLAIQLALEQDVDIINLSLTSTDQSTLLETIIKECENNGVIVIASSGNNSANVDNYTPANIDYVTTISSLDENYNIATYSNFGSKIDYSAIGTMETETLSGREKQSGTSIATAYVTAIVANNHKENSSMETTLDGYVYDLGNVGRDDFYGNGCVSATPISLNNNNEDVFDFKIQQSLLDDTRNNYKLEIITSNNVEYTFDGGKTWQEENYIDINRFKEFYVNGEYLSSIRSLGIKDNQGNVLYKNFAIIDCNNPKDESSKEFDLTAVGMTSTSSTTGSGYYDTNADSTSVYNYYNFNYDITNATATNVRVTVANENTGTTQSFSFPSTLYITYNGTKTSLTVKSLGNGTKTCLSDATSGCITKVTIPTSVTSINPYAFRYSTVQSVTFTATSTCTTIDDYAFYYSDLTTITIPDSVTTIGEYAFGNCYSLVTLTLGMGLETIENNAFDNAPLSTKITINSINLATHNNVFNSISTKQLVFGTKVSQIPDHLFYMGELTSTKTITIPVSCKSIGEYAFYGVNATGVTFTATATCTSIGDYAFYSSALTTLTIPDSVLTIGKRAFYNNTSLATVIIGNGVTQINDYAFYNCTALTTLTIGTGVVSIGLDAFTNAPLSTKITYNCINLQSHSDVFNEKETKQIVLGGKVQYIPSNLFFNCTLTSTLTITIPISCLSIGDSAFYGVNTNALVFASSSTASPTCKYVGAYSFYGTNLTTITIPASVIEIGAYAFYDCSAIATATIGNGVVTIGDYAFGECIALSTLTLGTKVESIGVGVFTNAPLSTKITFNCINLTTHNNVFNNKSTKQIAIGGTITRIEDNLFYGCELTSTKTITIPATCVYIGDYSFYGVNLTSVTFNGTSKCTYIGDYAFYSNDLTTIAIPNSVLTIGNHAFEDCQKMTTATIGNGTTIVGDKAFYNCIALITTTIGTNVETIGGEAFANAPLTNLITYNAIDLKEDNGNFQNKVTKQIAIGTKVTQIPDSLFYGCELTNTKTITIPATCTNIGDYAFYNVNANTLTFTATSTCKNVGDYAFYGSDLTAVVIPDSTTTIGTNAFAECTKLLTLTIGTNVTSIGVDAFLNAPLSTKITYNAIDLEEHNDVLIGKTTGQIVIGGKVTQIPNGLFYNCKLTTTKTIAIPATCTKIEDYAFANVDVTGVTFTATSTCVTIGDYAFYCTALTTITIPDSVKSIGVSAFYGCEALATVVIGNGVEIIYEQAFMDCISLTTLTLGTSLTTIYDYAFTNAPLSTKITYNCIDLRTHNFELNDKETKQIVIGGKVTQIPYYLFYYCKLTGTTTITIPATCIDIGNYAFYNVNVTGITFAGTPTCTNIGNYAFYNSALTTLSLPASIITIGNFAFYDSDALTTLMVGTGTTTIGNNAFGNCTAMTKVTFTKTSSLTTIGDYAFMNCNSLATIVSDGLTNYLPTTLEKIGRQGFYGCSSLTSLVFKDSLKSIGYKAFADCTSLHTFTYNNEGGCANLGDKMTSLGNYVFNNTSIYNIRIFSNDTTNIGMLVESDQIVRCMKGSVAEEKAKQSGAYVVYYYSQDNDSSTKVTTGAAQSALLFSGIGRYNLNYTGASNYYYETDSLAHKSTSLLNMNHLEYDHTTTYVANSSGAKLEITDGCVVKKAYLLYEPHVTQTTAENLKVPEFYITISYNPEKETTNFLPEKSIEILPDHYMYNNADNPQAYVEITDFIKENGEGYYYVSSIPHYYGTSDVSASWKILMIEENFEDTEAPLRAISLYATYFYKSNSEESWAYTSTFSKSLPNGITTKTSSQAYATLYYGVSNGDSITNLNQFQYSIDKGTRSWKANPNVIIDGNYIRSGNIPNRLIFTKNGLPIEQIRDITTGAYYLNNTALTKANTASTYTTTESDYPVTGSDAELLTNVEVPGGMTYLSARMGARTKVIVLNSIGIAADIEDLAFDTTQITDVRTSTYAIVFGKTRNTIYEDTALSEIGIQDGYYKVTLDNSFIPIDTTSIVGTLVLDGVTSKIQGVYDETTRVITFDGISLLDQDDEFSYSIECNVVNNGKTSFKNYARYDGYYYNNGLKTDYIEQVDNINSTANALYKLTINPNGGIWETHNETQIRYHKVDDVITINPPTREGHTFGFWMINPTTITLLDYQFTMPNEDVSFVANWDIHTSGLIVDPNGGTWNGYETQQTYAKDYNNTLAIPTPTMPNYTITFSPNSRDVLPTSYTTTKAFGEWTKSEPFYGTMSDLTSNAIYTFGPENGVTSTITANYIGDYNVTLPTPTKAYNIFNGWFTEPENGIKIGDAEDVIVVNESSTYYAQWTPYSSTLKVNPNGGVWNEFTTIQTYTQDYDTILTIPMPTIENFTATFETNGGTISTTTITTNKFFHTWKKSSIFYGAMNNPTNDTTYTFGTTNDVIDSITATYLGSYNITLPTPTKEGYTFVGWYTNENGGTKVGFGGDVVTLSKDDVYYAQWTINSSTLEVNPNGGIWNNHTTIQSYTQNYDTTLDIPTPIVNNYSLEFYYNDETTPNSILTTNKTFKEWIKSEPLYGDIDNLSEDTIYTFGLENDTISTITATYDGSNELTIPTPTRNGFIFNGWYTKEVGGTRVYIGGETISVNSNETYYAQWGELRSEITYIDVVNDINGKELGRTIKEVGRDTFVSGSNLGSNTSDNVYYTGYYYDSCTEGVASEETFTVYRIFKLRTIEITGNVLWEDWNNKNLSRPNKVSVIVKDDDNNIVSTIDVDETTNWSYKKEFPKYNSNKEIITYSVSQEKCMSREIGIEYLEPQKQDDNYSFLNIATIVPNFDIYLDLSWLDNNDYYYYRPETITIELLKDNVVIEEKIINNKMKNNICVFEDLYKYDENGEPYSYKINTQSVDRYDLSISSLNEENVIDVVYTFTEPVYGVVIPKTIVLDGQTGIGEYQVQVNGVIDDRDSIFVVPDKTFVMSDNDLFFRNAYVEQSLSQFNNDNGLKNGINEVGTITMEDIVAGSWYGKFNFNIYFEFGE